jgi:hypothetical protein
MISNNNAALTLLFRLARLADPQRHLNPERLTRPEFEAAVNL